MPPLWRDWRFYLLLLLAPLLMGLAYQVRRPAGLDVGAFGDRAYLWASPLQADLGFNGDERLAAEGISYRWTKRVSWVRFPDLGWNGPVRVSLRARGWRPEPQLRPKVEVTVNGVVAGGFSTTGEWQEQAFELAAYPGHTSDLEVALKCVPFTPGGTDKRILGVQWDWVRVEPLPGGSFPAVPPWRQLLLWGSVILLAYLSLRRRWPVAAFWTGLALVVLVAAGLAFLRHIFTPYAEWALYAAGAGFLLAHADLGWRWLRQLGRRGRSLPFWAALIGAAAVVVVGYVRWAVGAVPTLGPRPDAILLVVFFAAAVAYALLIWDRPLRRRLARLDERLRRPWLPGLLLGALIAGVTIYEFDFIREMRFIGHADYADNAVVARNLLAGRGFTVDYVAQFYRPDIPLSHPQETWPLMQPVLIAPFFHFLGDLPWAAKIPNLFLQLALALVLYAVGAGLFDRRVGLVAVVLTLLNPFFFRLIIFPTGDLVFTLLALLTLAQFFRASERERYGQPAVGSYLWAGAWAGLLMLAKPNGILFTGVVMLWDFFWRWREHRWRGWWRAWLAFGLPAAALLSPWVIRNLILFRTPIYSTEQFDAWILKYRDWEEIYRVYFDDLPNRSWLLRYGFDRVLEAIGTEFRKWWQYFSVDSNALLTLVGSALALGGALTLRKRSARLFSLVGLVFVLFSIFICAYWHVEERYFLPFIPWLALLAARGLWWVHDALAYRRDDEGRPASSGFGWLGLLVVVLGCLHLVAPFSVEAAQKAAMDQAKQVEIQAFTWLAENSSPDDVVMTRVPWQLTYYSGRRSVMIPLDGLEEVERIAEMYGGDYLLIEGDARGKRPALRQALAGGSPWPLVYDQGGVQIYRLNGEP